MFTALLILQVVLGLTIIALVLLQQGKGADMGAAFGAGASGTVFGSRGGGSFFTRATAVMAAAFFINSILLSSPLVHKARNPDASVTSSVPVVEVEAVEEADLPAVDVDAVTDLPPADLPDADGMAEEAPLDDLPEVAEPVESAVDPATDKPE